MEKQITRLEMYFLQDCKKCTYFNCIGYCGSCKNRIKMTHCNSSACACLQAKSTEEKTCPFFKERKK